jgi:hypothetical protein
MKTRNCLPPVILMLASGFSHAQPLATDKIFAPASFWYMPVPANTPLHPNSANYVRDFLRQKAAYYNTVNINTREYTSPVYVVGKEVPPVRVTQWDCQKKGYTDPNLAAQWSAVPIPSYAVQSKGTDGEMTVYQPSTDTIWEFWQARKVNGSWQACWGGRLASASASDGSFPGHYGTTATGLPFIGGQITPDELQRGEIKHVMGISLVEIEHFNIFSWPARRSDGWNSQRIPNRIPEGTRLRLDPNVNVDALPMSRAGKTIAKAAQKYGFVVWDRAGAISLRAQNAYTYLAQGQPDPYPPLFQNKPSYSVLDGFPWEKLQFLPANYRVAAATEAPAPVSPIPVTPAPVVQPPANVVDVPPPLPAAPPAAPTQSQAAPPKPAPAPVARPQPAPTPPKPTGLLDQVRNYLKRTLGR